MFNVGVNPSDIIFIGKYGYVANSNNNGIAGSDTISVIDTESPIATTISDPSFNGPYRLATWKHYVIVCNSNTTTLSLIDTLSNTVTRVIDGLNGPGGIVVVGNIAYVTNYGVKSGTGSDVRVVDLSTNEVTATIATNLAPSAVKASADGKRLFVTCYVDGNPNTGTLEVISTREQRVLRTISGLFGPFALEVDNHHVYVTNFGSNNFTPYGTTVAVISLKSFRIIKQIEIGIQPAAITASEKYLYVSTYNSLYNGDALVYGLSSIATISKKSLKVKEIKPAMFSVSALRLHSDKLYLGHYSLNVVTTM